MPTLDDAVARTEAVLTDLIGRADPRRIYVAWTGGKDSTLVLFAWKTLLDHHGLDPVRAINLDTGCKFPEVLAFRDSLADEWGVDLRVARPAVSPEGYPLAVDPLACCRDLKVEPLKAAIRAAGATHLLSGIRRDEHPDRAGREVLEPRTDPDYTLVNPILHLTETDVWALHARFGLPRCGLYDLGYRSLGCMPCTRLPNKGESERAGRSSDKEAVLSTLTGLGYF
ncbi:MAG: phosphoadenosine phosphosulfate reductase family protein [Desulfovibrionaceae bacterium]|nr:phosphoadenosine phosphosulfate reductase family protein [Desulfovibrionaceae bacterium]